MFGLFLLTLFVAILTERRQEIVANDKLAMGEKIGLDIALEQTRLDQKKIRHNK